MSNLSQLSQDISEKCLTTIKGVKQPAFTHLKVTHKDDLSVVIYFVCSEEFREEPNPCTRSNALIKKALADLNLSHLQTITHYEYVETWKH